MAQKVAYRHSIKISSRKWKITLVMIYIVKFYIVCDNSFTKTFRTQQPHRYK